MIGQENTEFVDELLFIPSALYAEHSKFDLFKFGFTGGPVDISLFSDFLWPFLKDGQLEYYSAFCLIQPLDAPEFIAQGSHTTSSTYVPDIGVTKVRLPFIPRAWMNA